MRHGDERTCQQVLRAKHPFENIRFWLQSWRARLSTGASREAPVENICVWLQSWQARLSTGASREAFVENISFWLQS